MQTGLAPRPIREVRVLGPNNGLRVARPCFDSVVRGRAQTDVVHMIADMASGREPPR